MNNLTLVMVLLRFEYRSHSSPVQSSPENASSYIQTYIKPARPNEHLHTHQKTYIFHASPPRTQRQEIGNQITSNQSKLPRPNKSTFLPSLPKQTYYILSTYMKNIQPSIAPFFSAPLASPLILSYLILPYYTVPYRITPYCTVS